MLKISLNSIGDFPEDFILAKKVKTKYGQFITFQVLDKKYKTHTDKF